LIAYKEPLLPDNEAELIAISFPVFLNANGPRSLAELKRHVHNKISARSEHL
jgi:hypothetical protein